MAAVMNRAHNLAVGAFMTLLAVLNLPIAFSVVLISFGAVVTALWLVLCGP